MRRARGLLVVVPTLFALLLGCFSQLVAHPRWLLADGERSSIDYASRDVRPPGNDLIFLFLPHYIRISDQVNRLGRLPHWDSSGFAGRPLIGNPQAGLFYPLFWVAIWARSPASLGWLTVAHLLWAGLGTYLLVRSFGAGVLASTMAAGCFAASPYVLAHTFEGHYPHIWAVCWYPWAFLAFARGRSGHRAWLWTLPLILALCFLAGHPQEWYYLVFVLGVWGLADVVAAFRAKQPAGAIRIGTTWVVMLSLMVGLVAIELVPDILAQRWTLRGSRIGLGRLNHYQLHPLNLFQLLGPGALGNAANYFGHDNLWESLFSIGLVPLTLAVVAVAVHPNRRLVRGWLLLVGGTTLFAAGKYFGLFAILYELVPGMNRFRVPSRSLFLASLGGAVLAGLGVDALMRRMGERGVWLLLFARGRKIAIWLVAGLVLMTFFAASDHAVRAVWRSNAPYDPAAKPVRVHHSMLDLDIMPFAAIQVLRSGAFWLSLGGTLTIVAMGLKIESRRRMAVASLVGLALVELTIHANAMARVTPAATFMGDDPVSTNLAEASRGLDGPFRIRARDTMYSDLRAVAHGFEKININDSFQIQHAADLYESLYALLYVLPLPDPREPMSAATAEFFRHVRQAVLDRLCVAFLVSDHVELDPAWPLISRGIWNGSTYAIHRNPSAMPRAYVVPRAEVIREGAGVALSQGRFTDPRQAVMMTADPLDGRGPRQPFTPARFVEKSPDDLEIRVETQAPGLLVIADTWMPGWTARVDDRPADILRGNHAQRVIPIDKSGSHVINLQYEAPGWRLGHSVTLLALGLWLIGSLYSLRPPKD